MKFYSCLAVLVIAFAFTTNAQSEDGDNNGFDGNNSPIGIPSDIGSSGDNPFASIQPQEIETGNNFEADIGRPSQNQQFGSIGGNDPFSLNQSAGVHRRPPHHRRRHRQRSPYDRSGRGNQQVGGNDQFNAPPPPPPFAAMSDDAPVDEQMDSPPSPTQGDDGLNGFNPGRKRSFDEFNSDNNQNQEDGADSDGRRVRRRNQ